LVLCGILLAGHCVAESISVDANCEPNIPADVSGDCTVDLFDYSIIAGNWLKDNIEQQEILIATEVWSAFYDGLGHDQDEITAISVDNFGNVYVTGYSDTKWPGDDNAYTTIKYNSNGNRIWTALYQMYNTDTATDIAVDNAGNVYITGSYYYTIKYDANGNELWVAHYEEGREATSIEVDSNGNVYVTGWSIGQDFATIKYNTNGSEVWTKLYDGGENQSDVAQDLIIDDLGNVYVTGWSHYENPTGYDYTTIKYSNNGNEVWVRRHGGAYPIISPASITIDEQRNVYITCLTGTIKYDNNGNQLWFSSFWGKALIADKDENLYVTGIVGNNYSTRKYDPNGNTLWIAFYDGAIGNNDFPTDIALDESGVYVTGWSSGSGYVTVKYDPNGNELWVISSDAYSGDYSPSIVLDNSGNIYVAGRKYMGSSAGGQNFITFKYKQEIAVVDICLEQIEGDTNHDCIVDFEDLAELVYSWLVCNLDPPEACL
jgi:hypothetical protein